MSQSDKRSRQECELAMDEWWNSHNERPHFADAADGFRAGWEASLATPPPALATGETPRTDTVWKAIGNLGHDRYDLMHNHARQLERELSATNLLRAAAGRTIARLSQLSATREFDLHPICELCDDPRDCHNGDYCYRHYRTLSFVTERREP